MSHFMPHPRPTPTHTRSVKRTVVRVACLLRTHSSSDRTWRRSYGSSVRQN